MKYKTKQTIFSILAFLIILGGTILAGSLIPTGPVGTPTMYTLSDIYNKLTIPSYTSSPTHSVSTSSSPTTGTFKTLTEIWSAIPSYLTGDTSNATSTRSGTTLTLTIPRGISDGTATLSTTSANLIAGNILSSASIFGLTGTANDPAGATEGRVVASASGDVMSGKFAFSTDGTIINGTGSAGTPAPTWAVADVSWPAPWNGPEAQTPFADWTTANTACLTTYSESGKPAGTWRLPTIIDLFDKYSAVGGYVSWASGSYWSSTEYPRDTTKVHTFQMDFDAFAPGGKSKTVSDYEYTRCVR